MLCFRDLSQPERVWLIDIVSFSWIRRDACSSLRYRLLTAARPTFGAPY
jgi:hypothetical protein